MTSTNRSAFSFGRVVAVAHNTYREALRNRAFIGLLVLALGFIVFSVVLSELTVVGQGPRVVLDFGFFALGLFGAATAIVMGAILVHKEVDKKTIFTIVSKPIQRYEFILGKYAGMLAILMVEIAVLAVFWFGVLLLQGGDVTIEHLKGVILICFEVALVTSVAVMFSSISSPIVTALLTTGAFAVGRVVVVVDEMLGATRGVFVDNPLARLLGQGVVLVLPDLSVFNASQQVLLDIPVTWTYVAQALAYGAGYVVICLAIALLAFQRRDFV